MSTKLRSLIALIGVVLMSLGVSLGPVATATATGGGNNGTIKIHEQGTPSGTESNDPKVCSFNVEGFGFDAGQTGYIVFDVQGGDGPTGTAAGPYDFGPTNADGYYATQYFSLDDGHYKATLYGKSGDGVNYNDVKAKSKVFKVECAPPPPVTPEGSNNSSSPSCEKITVGTPTGVKPEGATVVVKLDGVVTQPGTYDATPGSHVVTTYVNGTEVDSDTVMVAKCAGDQPADKVTYTEWKDGDKSCESKTVTQTRTKTVTPYTWNGSDWVLDTANATSTTETQTRPMTDEELKACDDTPPPPDDSCPNLTGSVKTTLADGSVVNGNIYDAKSDVYISGSQLGDVTTVYIRVTDPSGSTVLSDVKQVTVTDGSFGPVQLPTYADSPNNGDEYKVWVSTSSDFENNKCTKFDNFKVRGDEPPPPVTPEGAVVVASNDCETITFSSKDVKPEDAEVIFKLDGQTKAAGTYDVAPGQHTVELFVNGEKTDSKTVTVEECEQPPTYVVTVVPNQGSCDVRSPEAQVTTNFASSIGYRLQGEDTKFVYTEVPAGTYTLTLPGVSPGGTVSYEVVVAPLDDSAEPIVKGPFHFSVSKDCDEVPPCTKYQDEDAGQPCYVERQPDVRTESSERDSCKLGGTETTTTVYTTTWEFNEETQQWESSKTGASSVAFEPYTAAQLAKCHKTPHHPHNPPNGTPPTTTPTFVPPHTGGGTWPTDFASSQDTSLSSLLSKLIVLMGGALLLVTVFAPRRRGKSTI